MTSIARSSSSSQALLRGAHARVASSISPPSISPSRTRAAYGHACSSAAAGPSSPRHFTTTPLTPSGHNKWSKIKHKKMAADSARSNVFSRVTHEITAAIRSGGPSPESNARLAVLLKKAKSLNFPKDRLETTFAKATKSGSENTFQQQTWEIMGPITKDGQSVALIVECETESPGHNRKILKEALKKITRNNAHIAVVGHMFTRKGVIRLTPAQGSSIDAAFELAIDHGAEDMIESEPESQAEADAVGEDGTVMEIHCQPSDLNTMTETLSKEGHDLHESETRMLVVGPPLRLREEDVEGAEPETDIETAGWVDEATLTQLNQLKDHLEDQAGCTRIWSNIHSWP